jgi:DNA-binding PadR family transcriptional regulator
VSEGPLCLTTESDHTSVRCTIAYYAIPADTMTGHRDPNSELPLAPVPFEILLALSRGPLHGYGIVQEIREQTDGQIDLSTSSLYTAVRRLLRDGLVEDAKDHPSGDSAGPARRNYRVTAFGLAVARLEAQRLKGRVGLAEDRLAEGTTS